MIIDFNKFRNFFPQRSSLSSMKTTSKQSKFTGEMMFVKFTTQNVRTIRKKHINTKDIQEKTTFGQLLISVVVEKELKVVSLVST